MARREDPFCEWCRLWEERLWRAFVLLSTLIALLGALVVALRHLPGVESAVRSARSAVSRD